MDIIVIENFLPDQQATTLCNEASNASYNYYHRGDVKKPQYHWHKNWCPLSLSINTVMPEKFILQTELIQYYRNAHTYGVYPTKHRDNEQGYGKQYTALYYPELGWRKEYGGGLYVFSQNEKDCVHIPYAGNKLVLIDGYAYHACEGLDKNTSLLRSVFVLKYQNKFDQPIDLMNTFERGEIVKCLDTI